MIFEIPCYLLVEMRAVFADDVVRMTGVDEVVRECTGIDTGFQEELAMLPNNYRVRSEEHTSELQSRQYLVCRLLLEKKKIGRVSILTVIS